MSLIPPLLFYFYSPYLMEGTTLNNGKNNSTFFDTYLSTFGSAANITINNNPQKFSNEIICSSLNKFATLFLNINNNNLYDPFGNLTCKVTFLKLDQLKNIYIIGGLIIFYMYDNKNFNFGTIICNFQNQDYSNIADINGNIAFNSISKLKIIKADGYYYYLNFSFVLDQQNEITIEINNGIRKLIIPNDPTGLYIPVFIDSSTVNLVPSFYFQNYDYTFKNSDLQIEEYNLQTSLYLDENLTIKIGEFNNLAIINKNIFNSNFNDGLFFGMISINNSSPLLQTGNILVLSYSSNYNVGSIGYSSKIGSKLPLIIIYGDGDYEYLNFAFNFAPTSVILINPNLSRTLFLPPKPKNFTFPTISYPDNKILPGKILYNKFYSETSTNSVIFDTSSQYQNITLFSNIYDSFDNVTGKFGNVIGKITTYKFILTKNNETYSTEFNYITFIDNDYLTSVYVLKNGLDKYGSISQDLMINTLIIAASSDYGYSSWYIKIESNDKSNYFQVGFLQ
jgi:hypothetical protein